MTNEWFTLYLKGSLVYISVAASGFQLKDLEPILKENPRIVIKNFMALRSAIQAATGEETEVGHIREDIEITVSRDKMEARVKLNFPDEEFALKQRDMQANVIAKLREAQVTEGILVDVLQNGLAANQEIVIAKGIPPINGLDAVVTYYEIPDKKPAIRHDGNADFYEMNFTSLVKEQEWLGEKISATEGTPGMTVTGETIPATPGKDKFLLYDSQTVYESEEDGKIVLRALMDGAVEFDQGKIGILRHLVIKGDVGLDTGNIEFKGCVTVHGVVQDGFSVVADQDISILGNMGLGSIERIESRGGDIFIKGGVFGKGKALIQAANNVYLKHANECNVVAGNSIHIGLYSIGSVLQAKNIILDQQRGKIVGGEVRAEVQVIAAEVGNKLERPTHIHVAGFNRQEVKQELDQLLKVYKESLRELEGVKRELEIYEMYLHKMEEKQLEEFKKYIKVYEDMVMRLNEMESKRKGLMEYLETRGEGQVSILQKVYPKTMMQLKNVQERIEKVTTGTFYVMGNQLFTER
ncbi:DUF342 domain-containing protein [Brevibacillus ginsengisoli]|uniref:DUF342 domain-containing protein n=1 Tax=Brevibacillus ginsengisoli TaxID=363854 RepID=UPI003CF2A348